MRTYPAPTHDLVDHPPRNAEQREHGAGGVLGVVQPTVRNPCVCQQPLPAVVVRVRAGPEGPPLPPQAFYMYSMQRKIGDASSSMSY